MRQRFFTYILAMSLASTVHLSVRQHAIQFVLLGPRPFIHFQRLWRSVSDAREPLKRRLSDRQDQAGVSSCFVPGLGRIIPTLQMRHGALNNPRLRTVLTMV